MTLNEILRDEYLDKGFINTLYIDEDLAFDIFSFQERYSLYLKTKKIFDNYKLKFHFNNGLKIKILNNI